MALIEDYALLGDLETAALVSRHGGAGCTNGSSTACAH
jgi:hypothetical protein